MEAKKILESCPVRFVETAPFTMKTAILLEDAIEAVNNCEIMKLKLSMIDTYRKYGDKISLKFKQNSYTGNQIADEISKNSPIGIDICYNIIRLSIDLLKRDKINL